MDIRTAIKQSKVTLEKRKTVSLRVRRNNKLVEGVYPADLLINASTNGKKLPFAKFIMHNMDKQDRHCDFSLEDIISISSHRKDLYFNKDLARSILPSYHIPPATETITTAIQDEFRRLGELALQAGHSRLGIAVKRDDATPVVAINEQTQLDNNIIKGTICSLTLKAVFKPKMRTSDLQPNDTTDSIFDTYKRKYRFFDVTQVQELYIDKKKVYDKKQFVAKIQAN